jgi:hypothetical protein
MTYYDEREGYRKKSIQSEPQRNYQKITNTGSLLVALRSHQLMASNSFKFKAYHQE